MKSSELMLGDWLQHADGSYHQVRVIEVGHFACGLPHLWEYNNQFSPVLLTREILEKNGLSNRMEFKRFQFIDVIGTQENPIFYWTKRVEDDAVTTVQQLYYVHELQHALRLCKIDKEIVL